ncbi:hypothetical protein DW2_06078 [Thioclava atlantica]|uniref:Uncharacterized protein n=2 Tax=Thioclava atlantica TaxID=1317124 RepID=A0A085TXQ9_9RHOB|nr:hypothetical protein DW2_06078 [Thioclava atlantica]
MLVSFSDGREITYRGVPEHLYREFAAAYARCVESIKAQDKATSEPQKKTARTKSFTKPKRISEEAFTPHSTLETI